MSYSAAEGRSEILARVGSAIEDLAVSLAALGEAYELLDEAAAQRLEEQLFQPVQSAYAVAMKTASGFAARIGSPSRRFVAGPAGHPSQGATGFIAGAVERAETADAILAELQDTLLPVEVGDEQLRAGLSHVRRLLADVPQRARRFGATLGR